MHTFAPLRRLITAVAIAAAIVMAASPARAATIGLLILEGSDSQTYHNLLPYSTEFLNGLNAFSTAPALPILIIGSAGEAPAGSPTIPFVVSATVPTLADLLANYAGIYLSSPFTCCDERSITAGEAADIRAFLEAGRSVAIEDYQGGAVYDVVIGNTGAGAGTANAHVAGLGGGYAGLGDCFDGNVVAAGGSAYGLGPVGTAIPNIGCFGHQAYQETFFDPLGLVTYIATNPGFPGFNVVISNGGGGLNEAIPEPASMALFGVAMAGFGAYRRRVSAKAKA